MKDAIEKRLRTLGSPVKLSFPEEIREITALIVPSGTAFEPARKAEGLSDGYLPPGSYELYCAADVDISEAISVSDGRISYLFRRKELYQAGGVPLYWWGILVQGGVRDDGT